jgi:hypothetical protein
MYGTAYREALNRTLIMEEEFLYGASSFVEAKRHTKAAKKVSGRADKPKKTKGG